MLAGVELAPCTNELPGIIEHDRKQAGWSVGPRGTWAVSVGEYLELEAGKRPPRFETWERICKLYGWPQTFATRA